MKDIDRICRDHGLKYYLHAGTLLGAFNHKGFIPWDDDVDISLLREDYEKLCAILQCEHADRYFLHNYETDHNYSNNRAVLRVLGTRVIYHHENPNNEHSEIGVDIVPLDATPDGKLARKFQQTAIWILTQLCRSNAGRSFPTIR